MAVNKAISATLQHLEKILREGDDNASADKARRILESPDSISALHRTFASHLKRTSRVDLSSQDRRQWFQRFSSQRENCFDDQQLDKLTAVTRNWALPDEKSDALVSCSLLWASSPHLFWQGQSPKSHMIQRCLDDLDRIKEIDPLRRKVILTILSECVSCEQEQMRSCGKRQRSRASKDNGMHRGQILLPTSLRSIVRRLWPGVSHEEQRKLKRKLSFGSRYGWKWQQIRSPGMILSLPDCSTKRFETAKWTPAEFEAINQFVKTLPQWRFQPLLNQTMKTLVSFYHSTAGQDMMTNAPSNNPSLQDTVVHQRLSPRQSFDNRSIQMLQSIETQEPEELRSTSSIIPRRNVTMSESSEVEPSSQAAQIAQRDRVTDPQDNPDGQDIRVSRVLSESPRSTRDFRESPLYRAYSQVFSDSRCEKSVSPRILEVTADDRLEFGLNRPGTCQAHQSEFSSLDNSDMMMPYTSITPSLCQNVNEAACGQRRINDTNLAMQSLDSQYLRSCQAVQNIYDAAQYTQNMNDTDLAMQNLFSQNPQFPCEIDASSAVHRYTSEAGWPRQPVDLHPAGDVNVTNEQRPLDAIRINDTSLALLAIELQSQEKPIHRPSSDTNITKLAFASEYFAIGSSIQATARDAFEH